MFLLLHFLLGWKKKPSKREPQTLVTEPKLTEEKAETQPGKTVEPQKNFTEEEKTNWEKLGMDASVHIAY